MVVVKMNIIYMTDRIKILSSHYCVVVVVVVVVIIDDLISTRKNEYSTGRKREFIYIQLTQTRRITDEVDVH